MSEGTDPVLQLKSLKIQRAMYGKNEGSFEGAIVFDGERGEVSLIVTPELAHKFFLLCADAVIDTAKLAATSLMVEAQDSIARDITPPKVGAPP